MFAECCWAITSAALVSHQLKACNLDLNDFEASSQELIDRCAGEMFEGETDPPDHRGCFGVAPEDALRYVQLHGITLESAYPLQYRRQIDIEPPQVYVCLFTKTNNTIAFH